MPTYLLDTTVIIDVLNGKRNRNLLLKEFLNQGHLLACCPINVTEVYAGMRPTEEAATDALLQSLEYYGVTWDIARQAGLLRRDYARKGVTIALADATIAAVVLSHQLILVTDNAKHFPIKGLQLYPLPQL